MKMPSHGANQNALPAGQAPRGRAAIHGRNLLPFHQTPALGATHDLLVMIPHPQIGPRPGMDPRRAGEGGEP